MSAPLTMFKTEAKLLARNPGVLIWTIVLPVAAMIALAAIPALRQPVAELDGLSFFAAYQPILVLFALTIVALQVLPDVLTRYRQLKILKRLRTTPASPALLLWVQLMLTLIVAVISAIAMVLIPLLLGAGAPRNLVGFAIAFALSAWAVMGIGMLIASVFNDAKVALGFGTALFFILQFMAGLWLPRSAMPDWMRHISDATPTGAGAGALTDTAIGAWPQLLHLAVLALWGLGATGLAIRYFRWE